MLYCYLKATPKIRGENRFRFLPFSLVTFGLFLIGNAFFPVFLYQLRNFRFSPSIVLTPVEGSYETNDEYNNYKNWFTVTPKFSPRLSKVTHYNLSIPKLKIEKAVVTIGGENLAESLIHYPGTALPGEYGNAVVFGHSVLPQFFNPKKYKTIFSTLPNLKEGDEILVDFDGIQYRYLVVEMVEVSPNDISVLEQRYDGEYLSLITCVPPGTYLRRLIVKAKLASPS